MSPLAWLVLINILSACNGALRFARSYGDHMVLQRAPQHAVIWGFADHNGDGITAQIVGHGNPVHTKVVNGQWKLKLPPMFNEGPHTIKVSSNNEGSISLHDVLFGDVWVCSGQSNMAYWLKDANNGANEVQKSFNFHKIRLFRAFGDESNTPLADLKNSKPWTAPSAGVAPWFSAVCLMYGEYLYNHRKYPIGLIEADRGGTPIEPWSSPAAMSKCQNKGKRAAPPHNPSVLWNSMIHPLLKMTIYGVVWYQGESNAWNAHHYLCQQTAMVNDWRQQFYQGSLGETSNKFPFGLVQLAASSPDKSHIGGFPSLRWSQTGEMGYLPNFKYPDYFMAVAMDLPDFKSPKGSLHPRTKQDVAQRLGLASLGVAYGQKGLAYKGPYPSSFTNKGGNQVQIEYDNGHTVLDVRSNSGFEVCCSWSQNSCSNKDTWVGSPVMNHHGATVTLNTSGCQNKHVVGVRYAWRESPCDFKKCAIYGRDNDLPGPPFIRNIAV